VLTEIAAAVGLKVGGLLAAIFGALVSIPFIPSPYEERGKASIYKTSVLGCGILSAIYVGPLVVHYTELAKAENAIIFLTGTFFMSFATAIHKAAQQADLRMLSEMLKTWFTGPKK